MLVEMEVVAIRKKTSLCFPSSMDSCYISPDYNPGSTGNLLSVFTHAVRLVLFHRKVPKFSRMPADAGFLYDRSTVLRDMLKCTP
jgi:hypothetical protein